MATLPLQPGTAPANAPAYLLQAELSTALRRFNTPPIRFGREALRDLQFVADVMRRGRTPRPPTTEKVRAFMPRLRKRVDMIDMQAVRLSPVVWPKLSCPNSTE
jgi:hypothetical protein